MPKLLTRIVALLLAPCLMADPITVMGSVGAGHCPRPQSEFQSIQSIQISGKHGGLFLQFPLTSQALADPVVSIPDHRAPYGFGSFLSESPAAGSGTSLAAGRQLTQPVPSAMLRIVQRLEEKHLVHPVYVNQSARIRELINPQHRVLVGVYGGAGVDFSGYLLATNARESYFIDSENAYRHFSAEVLRALFANPETFLASDAAKTYKTSKFEDGYAYQGWSLKEKDALAALVAELDGLGVDFKRIEIDETQSGIRLRFPWTYPDRHEELYSVTLVSGDLQWGWEHLRDKLPNKIGVYYQKAGYGIPYVYLDPESFITDLDSRMEEGAYHVTDDSVVSEGDMGDHFPLPYGVLSDGPLTGAEEAIRNLRKSKGREYTWPYGGVLRLRQKIPSSWMGRMERFPRSQLLADAREVVIGLLTGSGKQNFAHVSDACYRWAQQSDDHYTVMAYAASEALYFLNGRDRSDFLSELNRLSHSFSQNIEMRSDRILRSVRQAIDPYGTALRVDIPTRALEKIFEYAFRNQKPVEVFLADVRDARSPARSSFLSLVQDADQEDHVPDTPGMRRIVAAKHIEEFNRLVLEIQAMEMGKDREEKVQRIYEIMDQDVPKTHEISVVQDIFNAVWDYWGSHEAGGRLEELRRDFIRSHDYVVAAEVLHQIIVGQKPTKDLWRLRNPETDDKFLGEAHDAMRDAVIAAVQCAVDTLGPGWREFKSLIEGDSLEEGAGAHSLFNFGTRGGKGVPAMRASGHHRQDPEWMRPFHRLDTSAELAQFRGLPRPYQVLLLIRAESMPRRLMPHWEYDRLISVAHALEKASDPNDLGELQAIWDAWTEDEAKVFAPEEESPLFGLIRPLDRVIGTIIRRAELRLKFDRDEIMTIPEMTYLLFQPARRIASLILTGKQESNLLFDRDLLTLIQKMWDPKKNEIDADIKAAILANTHAHALAIRPGPSDFSRRPPEQRVAHLIPLARQGISELERLFRHIPIEMRGDADPAERFMTLQQLRLRPPKWMFIYYRTGALPAKEDSTAERSHIILQLRDWWSQGVVPSRAWLSRDPARMRLLRRIGRVFPKMKLSRVYDEAGLPIPGEWLLTPQGTSRYPVRLQREIAALRASGKPLSLETLYEENLFVQFLRHHAWNGAAALTELTGQPTALPALRDLPGHEEPAPLEFEELETSTPKSITQLQIFVPKSWTKEFGVESLSVQVTGARTPENILAALAEQHRPNIVGARFLIENIEDGHLYYRGDSVPLEVTQVRLVFESGKDGISITNRPIQELVFAGLWLLSMYAFSSPVWMATALFPLVFTLMKIAAGHTRNRARGIGWWASWVKPAAHSADPSTYLGSIFALEEIAHNLFEAARYRRQSNIVLTALDYAKGEIVAHLAQFVLVFTPVVRHLTLHQQFALQVSA